MLGKKNKGLKEKEKKRIYIQERKQKCYKYRGLLYLPERKIT